MAIGAHVQRGARQGHALAGDRSQRLRSAERADGERATARVADAAPAAWPRRRRSGCSRSARRSDAASPSTMPSRTHRDRSLVPGAHQADHRGEEQALARRRALADARPATSCARSSGRLLRPSHRRARRRERAATCARIGERLGVRAGLQARGHLRRRVRGHTPYLYSTYERTGTCSDEARPTTKKKVAHPGRRSQPHRPGHRVRLLLRPRRVRAARERLRDDHGQLQPGDGVDRLRHRRPAVLRAAHAAKTCSRSRARPRSPTASSCSSAGRRRCVSRCGLEAGGRADARHLGGRDRPRRGSASASAQVHREARAVGAKAPPYGTRHVEGGAAASPSASGYP